MNKMIENKKKFILLVAMVMVLLIGGAYAWLQLSISGTKTNVLQAGTLSLKLDNETENGISLSDAYPMTEQEGLDTTVYKFTLKNEGTIDSNYSIYLDDLDLDTGKVRMDDSIVKYRFQKNEEESTTGFLASLGQSPNRLLDSGVIESKDSIDYQLQVWMDYSADNTQQGTTLKAHLRVEANQIIDVDD